jgi:holo-[acyl-carrier protein] synthase
MTRLLRESPDLVEEVFTAREVEYAGGPSRAQHLAARFAAKEAVLKALGTGLDSRMRWREVEVVNDPGGRPRIRLHGEVAALARQQRVTVVEVSMSHTGGLALAQVVMLRGDSI